IIYMAAISAPTFDGGTTGFQNISAINLVAASFLSFDFTTGMFGTANPNFEGDPILFGLGQVAQFPGSKTNFPALCDHLNLTVNSVVPAPEPSAFLLVLASLVGLAWAKRRDAVRNLRRRNDGPELAKSL